MSHYRVANHIDLAQGGPGSKSVILNSPPQQMEIILQVCNYFHRDGGIWIPPLLLSLEDHIEKQARELIIDGLVIGAIIIIALYHLILLFYQRKRVENWYFFGFCIFISLRTIIVGDGELLFSLFPDTISWELARKLEYLGYYGPILFLAYFLRTLFPEEFKEWILRLAAWPHIIHIGIVLIFKAQFYSHIINYSHIFTLILTMIGLYTIVKASLQGREGATIFLLGFFILTLTTINDILVSKQISPLGYFSQYGLLFFIFSQSAIVSIRFSKAFSNLEVAEARLQKINMGLDQEVAKRTSELKSTNLQLQDEVNRHKKTLEEKEQIQAQVVHSSKLALLGQLAAGVGHEVNNPLTISIGNAKLLNKYLITLIGPDPQVDKRFGRISDANNRIKKIIDGLRIFARNENHLQEVTSLSDNIRLTVDMVSDIYRDEGIQVDFHLPESDVSVPGPTNGVQQMIMNLISNAKDATVNQAQRIVKISLEQSTNDRAIMTISDNGPGIPAEIKDKILDPFFTTKPPGSGTGMGLSLVDKTVDDMNGLISFDSGCGPGTTVTVDLPRCISQKEREQSGGPIAHSFNDKYNKKILVVDDEHDILDIIEEVLKATGCSVDTTSDGNIALELMGKNQYDYLFTDIKMPIMDGATLLKEMKKQELHYQPTIIIMTGGVDSPFDPSDQDMLSSMVDRYLLKPFDDDAILAILRNSSNSN